MEASNSWSPKGQYRDSFLLPFDNTNANADNLVLSTRKLFLNIQARIYARATGAAY
jgi:hypothetical protein